MMIVQLILMYMNIYIFSSQCFILLLMKGQFGVGSALCVPVTLCKCPLLPKCVFSVCYKQLFILPYSLELPLTFFKYCEEMFPQRSFPVKQAFAQSSACQVTHHFIINCDSMVFLFLYL